MKIMILGGSGMGGLGVLRECQLDPAVGQVLAMGRSAGAVSHPKLKQIVLADLARIAHLGSALDGYQRAVGASTPMYGTEGKQWTSTNIRPRNSCPDSACRCRRAA